MLEARRPIGDGLALERRRRDPIWLPLSSQAAALLKARPRRKDDGGT